MPTDPAQQAREEERAAIAAWLRAPNTVIAITREYVSRRKDGQITAASQTNMGVVRCGCLDAADAIERGEHLHPTP